MARVMLDECLSKVDNNRFDLVLVAAKRAHQLGSGHYKSTLDTGRDKCAVVSLREIEEGIVDMSILSETYELDDHPLSTPAEQAKEAAKIQEIEKELSQRTIDEKNDDLNIVDSDESK